MHHAQGVWLKNLSLAILFLTLIIIPRLSFATSGTETSNQQDKVIILRDSQSGAVIYRGRNAFYYGVKAPVTPGTPVPDASRTEIMNQGEINPAKIIVKYKPGALSLGSITGTIRPFDGRVHSLNGSLRMAVIKLNRIDNYFTVMREIKKNPNVAYAEPDYIAHTTAAPNDPFYRRQWGLQDIQAAAAWDQVSPGQRAGVIIAVLDTGVNTGQEDLQGVIMPGYNFIANHANPDDADGHGTHVAGIAAAVTNNGKGIAGVAGGSKIMPVKVLDDSGSGDYAAIISGIGYAADHGVTVVTASGNENGPVCSPGNLAGVITVGAVDRDNQRASFSNYGPELDVMAPGVDIISLFKGDASSYTMMSGTSMATPFVSGVAALVRAANPALSPAEVNRVIDDSAQHLATSGFDDYYGYGLVDAESAVKMAIHWQKPIPSDTPLDHSGVSKPAPVPSPEPNSALHQPTAAF